MSGSLLIIEDDLTMRETLGGVFRKKGIKVFQAGVGGAGLETLHKHSIDLLLLDMHLPDMSGLELWQKVKEAGEPPLCIFMTAFPEIKTAVAAMRQGAFDYINKPFELDELRMIVDKAFEVRKLKTQVQSLIYERDYRRKSMGMVGLSDAIKRVQEQIYQVAMADTTPVLILGESGTGKELVADAIHNLSARRDNPIMKINCSSIPENLLESELFGHEKGAFTDAKSSKTGIFEMAHTGTIFMDEIGDMSLSLQPKLLRVLESRTIRKVGGVKTINIDARIISATNQNLQSKVRKEIFRSDLLYRINVFTIHLPPLRERISDIPLLANYFLDDVKHSLNKEIDGIDKKAMELLKKYSWPGNIRELKNVLERACILAKSGYITARDCVIDSFFTQSEPALTNALFSIYDSWICLEELEFRYIKEVLAHCEGNKSEAARQLGISRVTLREKLKREYLAESTPGD